LNENLIVFRSIVKGILQIRFGRKHIGKAGPRMPRRIVGTSYRIWVLANSRFPSNIQGHRSETRVPERNRFNSTSRSCVRKIKSRGIQVRNLCSVCRVTCRSEGRCECAKINSHKW
jgi:hypothetical protein